MKTSFYSIYDNVAQVFNKPFMEINNATAIRAFTDSLEKEKHKNDYTLFHLGELDDQNGEITPCDVPIKILTGFDIKPVKEEQLPLSLQAQAE